MNAYQQHYVEKHDVQTKVDGMTAWEADEPFQRRLCTEREIAGQEEVDDETDNVACSIGYIFVCP